jgi:transcriptional regulator GlxA family with amidase domain
MTTAPHNAQPRQRLKFAERVWRNLRYLWLDLIVRATAGPRQKAGGRMTKAVRYAVPATLKPRRVAMLIYPGVTPLDVTGPLQVFDLANQRRKQKLYDVVTVAPTDKPVPTTLGFAFLPNCAMTELVLPVDTLLVSGGGGPDSGTQPAILDWLREATPRARRFGSICTGAFALGAAGLLNGKRATTHWAFGAELARRCPAAQVDIDPIFVRDGNLYSSAGITAGIDLALALVEEDHGRDLALDVARVLVLFLKRPGGQAQFSAQLRAQFSTVPAVRQVQLWCQEHLEADLRVSVLSKIAGMSERDFVRKFRQDTGRTPADYVTSARLEMACQLLTETRLSLKEVVRKCGFGSVAALRRAFVSRLGVPPRLYREHFQMSESADRSSHPVAADTVPDVPPNAPADRLRRLKAVS